MCEAIKGIREDARAEGIEEGMAMGMEKGRAEERSRIAENLRKSGMSEDQIKQILNI